MNYNFIKVATATNQMIVADCNYNTTQILECINIANENNTEILVFPELSITGYTCQDLFYQNTLIQDSLEGLNKIVQKSKKSSMIIAVGLPILVDENLYNCAAIIQEGNILGIVPKTYLANTNEHYEKRWFTSSIDSSINTINILGEDVPFTKNILFRAKNHPYLTIGVEIGSDYLAPISPSISHSLAGANLILHLRCNNEVAGSYLDDISHIESLSKKTKTGYISTNSSMLESTTDLVYSGSSYIYEIGRLVNKSKRFEDGNQITYGLIDTEAISVLKQKDSIFKDNMKLINKQEYLNVYFKYNQMEYSFDRNIHPFPFIPSDKNKRDEYFRDTLTLQETGLYKRIKHIGINKVVIGISGGLDSTLALIICVKAFDRLGLDRKGIIGVTMPGFGTTNRTYNNATKLMEKLGITIREISIVDATIQHFKDIGHDINNHDITYENTQARERTQILMDIANQVGGIVIGTGDLSEIALGWSTYNGDHMSMYAVNSGVPKTLIKYLIEWSAYNEFDNDIREILLDILGTPVSPELLPPSLDGNINQITEDVVGPYELHDFFLYYVVKYGFAPEKIAILAQIAFKGKYDYNTIIKWLKVFYKRFFSQQFKRSCIPDGPKVGYIGLSPRGDWKMPSDSSYNIWLSKIE